MNGKNSSELQGDNFISDKKYNVLDLFCGCGGMSLGFHLASEKFNIVAGIDIDESAIQSYRYNLVDKNPCLFFANDIRKIDPELFRIRLETHGVDKIDIIIGGPPCPGFSNIGRSKIQGLVRNGQWHSSEERHQFIEDERNQLFMEYVEFVDKFRPQLFLFENVKGMGSYKKSVDGADYHILDLIQEEFNNIGYQTTLDLLNSAEYGVPQMRERYFIIGKPRNEEINLEQIFPETSHDDGSEHISDDETRQMSLDESFGVSKSSNRIKPSVTSMQALIDLKHFPGVVYEEEKGKFDEFSYEYTIDDAVQEYRDRYEKPGKYIMKSEEEEVMRDFLSYIRETRMPNKRQRDYEINCHYPRVISASNRDDDIEIFELLRTEKYDRDDEGRLNVKYEDLPDELKRYGKSGWGDKMRRIPWWKPSWTIIAHLQQDGYMFIHPDRYTPQNRSITVREAARLQSFPDSFDFSAGGQIARGHQFRHVGNAVPPLMAMELAKSLLKVLKSHEKEY